MPTDNNISVKESNKNKQIQNLKIKTEKCGTLKLSQCQ